LFRHNQDWESPGLVTKRERRLQTTRVLEVSHTSGHSRAVTSLWEPSRKNDMRGTRSVGRIVRIVGISPGPPYLELVALQNALDPYLIVGEPTRQLLL